MSNDAELFNEPVRVRKPEDSLFGQVPGHRSPRGRFRRLLLWTLGTLVVLVLVAAALVPAVLSSSAVRRAVVTRLNAAQDDAEIEITGWSWRWFGSCRIDGLAVQRKDRAASLKIESVTFSKGMASWLGARQDFGTITVESPIFSAMEIPAEPPAPAPGLPYPSDVPPTPTEARADKPARRVDADATASGVPPIPINPFGEIVVKNGRAEAFPLEGAAIRIADIGAKLALAGLKGPVKAWFACGAPHRLGATTADNGLIEVEAETAVLLEALLHPATVPFQVRATLPSVDLAALDAFLPAAPDRPRIQSGLAEGSLRMQRAQSESLELKGALDLRTLRLSGGALGEDVVDWNEARLSVDAQQTSAGLTVRELLLHSPWATARASGTLARGDGSSTDGALTAQGEIDLAAVAAQLPGTLRLQPGTTLKKGIVKFDAEAATQTEGARVFAMLRCDGLDAERDGHPVRVDFPFSLGADARLGPSGELRHAKLQLNSPSVTLTLDGGVETGTAQGEVNLGPLTEALESLFALDATHRAAGRITLEGGWKTSQGLLAMTGALTGDRLLLAGNGAKPVEISKAQIVADARLLPANARGEREIGKASVHASLPFATLRASVDSCLPSESIVRGIDVVFEGQLPAMLALAGGKPEDAFAEKVSLALAGDLTAESLTMSSFRAAAGPFDLSGKGTLSELKGEQRLTVDGVSRIDLDQLQVLLKKRELDGIELAGKSERPFRLSTPLGGGRRYLLATTTADAAVLAQHLAGLGMTAANTEIAVKAAEGTLRLSAQSTVNDGRFSLEPVIDLLAEPPLLTLPGNSRVLTEARLTDAMLEQQLARIHPILKGCSVMGGTISIDMVDCSIPLVSNAVQRMTWTSALRLRDVRLAAAEPLDQAATALRLRQKDVVLTNQTMTVACREGRLYPQPLDLLLGGHALRIEGSAGLDGTLDYTVEIPLTEALVGEQAFRYLKKQRVRIPLSGTASKPRLDTGALEAEVRRLVAATVTKAATDALREQLKESVRDTEKLKEGVRDLDLKKLDTEKLEDAFRQLRRRN